MESKIEKENEIPLTNDKEINTVQSESNSKNQNEKKNNNSNHQKKQKNKEKNNKDKDKDNITNNNKINKNEEDQIGLWKVWKEHPPTPIPGSPQLTLMGWSLAALRTNFYIKELGLMLDAGLSAPEWTL